MSLKVDVEIKIDSEPCVAAWDDKLFVGTDDGFIKSFDENLTPVTSWPAHGAQLYALAAGNGSIYSTSNDGGIRVWTSEGQQVDELPITGADIGTLRIFNKYLYGGDEDGNVLVYENNKEKARYHMLEEVKDLDVSPPFLFTVRDLDVTITEIKPEESKARFITRHTVEGRAPLRVNGPHLLITARGGNNLRLHDSSVDNKFKQLHEIKVSDMIMTSLTVIGDCAWTGGWDGYVRRWKIAGNQLDPAGEINLGACINALVSTTDSTYVIVSGGKIVRIKAV